MSKSIKIVIGLVLVIIAAFVGYEVYISGHQRTAGAVSPTDVSATNYNEITASNGALINGGLTLGSAGTTINSIITGNLSSCTATSSITASQVAVEECAFPGLLTTDTVLASPGHKLSNNSLFLAGAFASTTANGFLDIAIGNASTTAIVSSSTDVQMIDYTVIR